MTPFERLEPRRLLAAGDLDAAFGGNGSVDIELTHPLFGVQRVIPVTGSGDVLVIGQEIRRFRADGSLDRAFGGGDGVIPLQQVFVDRNSYLENAAVLPDGRLIAVLFTSLGDAGPERLLVSFSADGSDGPTSIAALAGPADEIIPQGDGKVLVVGDEEVLRFNSDLTPDMSFGDLGIMPRLVRGAVDRAADGSFFAVGLNQSVPPKNVIAKFTPDGAPDTGFGNGGEIVTSDPDAAPVTEVQVDADGTLLTVIDGAVRRLKTSGQFDSSFGDGGASDPTFGDIAPDSPRLTPLPDGKILVIEGAGVTRLDADGGIDESYGRVLADLQDHGVLSADDAGRVFFTAAGRARPLALYRLSSGGPTSGRIYQDGGTVHCIGSDGVDVMRATLQNGDLMIYRRHDDVGRVFDPATVTLLNFQGLGGNDVITLASAGHVASTVSGGDGNDKILGGDGPDSLSGNAGRDTIYGGNGPDRLAGNGARDKLIGEGGNDRLYGGSSGDWLLGMGGDDQLYGEGGNDYLSGGSGFDMLRGSAGDDLLISNDSAIDNGGWVDYLYGDGGRDTAIADPNDILSSIEVRL